MIEMASAMHPWESFDNNIAAMVRIAMSNDAPAIPSELSALAQDFISKCLTRDPVARPTAKALLKHPWIMQVHGV